MFLVVKSNLIICNAASEQQAECIIKMEKARAEKKGYDTRSYTYGKILFDGEVDCHCGWYRRETKVQFDNAKIVTYCGALYRKEKN